MSWFINDCINYRGDISSHSKYHSISKYGTQIHKLIQIIKTFKPILYYGNDQARILYGVTIVY